MFGEPRPRDLGCDVVAASLHSPVRVGKERAEVLVEGLEDVARANQLGLAFEAAAIDRRGRDIEFRIGNADTFMSFSSAR